MRDITPMAPVHTFPFLSNAISYKYSNLIDHNISTVPFTRYLFTYPDINVARSVARFALGLKKTHKLFHIELKNGLHV